MKHINNPEYLSPDLYLRYHYGFEIIKNFQKNKPCKIIDVGGRAGIMGDFIKKEKLPYSLIVIDSLPDIKTKTVCDKYIQQDFLKFKTEIEFDYLVSFDVLEHVNNKETFINKCLSLCDSVIISAPFKSEITNFAENIVDQYFLKYKGIHHPWLKEHFKQSLPDVFWLKNLLNYNKIKFKIFDSNNIENWVNFMLPNLLPIFYIVDTKKLNKINQFYNQNYKDLGDKTLPSYRKIFVISPKVIDSPPEEFSSQKSKSNIQKKIIFTNMVIDFLTHTIKNEKETNKLKDEIINKNVKNTINKLKDEIINKNVKLKKEIERTDKKINDYTISLNQITNLKFYKIWQFYCSFKKFLIK